MKNLEKRGVLREISPPAWDEFPSPALVS